MFSPKVIFLTFFILSLALGACGTESGDDSNSGVCRETTARTNYPAGPYGVGEGDVLTNLGFKDSEGNDVAFENFYQEDGARLLLISTGAGWCSACIKEQPQLEAWSTQYKEKGLRVIMTVFEDALFGVADVAYAEKWKNDNNLTIPVLADGEKKMSEYYNSDLAPMNMIVEACTMKIVKIIIGADTSAIETIIEAKL